MGEHVTVSLGARLADLAARQPTAVAVRSVARDGTVTELTWSQLDAAAHHAARQVAARTRESTVVGISARSATAHAELSFGSWRAGRSVLPLPPELPEDERQRLTERVSGDLHVLTERDRHEVHGDTDEDGLTADHPVPDPALIFISGGSTGLPKLINGLGRGAFVPGTALGALSRSLGRRPDQRMLVCNPLYHAASAASTYIGLFEGCEVTVLERFDARLALDAIERFGIESVTLVPTMMQRMARSPSFRSDRLASVETVGHTGGPCPEWVKRAWIDVVGATRVYEVYGSAESVGHCVIRGDEWLKRPGSAGRPVNCDLKVVAEDGTVLGPGEVGEIFVRPHAEDIDALLQSKYVGDTAEFRRLDALSGYVSVGDMGRVDEDGYLYLEGRTSDVVNSGGANIHPEEIEQAVGALDGVDDCVALGVPDDDLGERLVVCVLPAPGHALRESRLREELSRRLQASKVPREFAFTADALRWETGKTRRSRLRERYWGQEAADAWPKPRP